MSPDARLSLGLLCTSLLALGAFLWWGFGPLPPRTRIGTDRVEVPGEISAGVQFVEVTDRIGLAGFRHDSGGLYDIRQAMAPGLGLLDLDSDGDLDLILLAGPAHPQGVAIYRNQLKEIGALRFVDITREAGITWRGAAQGVCAGDYDGDGDIDLFITAIGPNLLLQNQRVQTGKLQFLDRTGVAGVAGRSHWLVGIGTDRKIESGDLYQPSPAERNSGDVLEVPEFSTGASFGDLDLDGDLDLYVANYVSYIPLDDSPTAAPGRNEKRSFRPGTYPPQADRLFLNQGNGQFQEISREHELDLAPQRSLGAQFLHLDTDAYPDVLVAHDIAPNLALRNCDVPPGQQEWSFTQRRLVDQSSLLRLDDTRSGHGIARGDADVDGDLDLLVTNWRDEPTSLFLFSLTRTDTDSVYEEEGEIYDLGRPTEPLAGWGTAFFDFDNDGDEDCVIAHGGTSPLIDASPTCAAERLVLLQNLGGRFADVSATAGEPFTSHEYAARGLVVGDVDLDFDLDIVFVENNGGVHVLLNQRQNEPDVTSAVQASAHLVFSRHRFDGIGARIQLLFSDGFQFREVTSGGSYLSQPPLMVHFGIGSSEAVELGVYWPLLDLPRNPTSSGPLKSPRVYLGLRR